VKLNLDDTSKSAKHVLGVPWNYENDKFKIDIAHRKKPFAHRKKNRKLTLHIEKKQKRTLVCA